MEWSILYGRRMLLFSFFLIFSLLRKVVFLSRVAYCNNFAHPLTRTTHSELIYGTRNSELLANVLMSLRRLPYVFWSIECPSTITSPPFPLCAVSRENAEKIRVIPDGRSTLFLRFLFPQQHLKEGERDRRRHRTGAVDFYDYPSKYFVRGLDTWWIFPGPSCAWLCLPSAFALLLRIFRVPISIPSARDGPWTKCVSCPLLFEEEISQSNTPYAERAVLGRLSWPLHGKLPFEKVPEKFLPTVKMISLLRRAFGTCHSANGSTGGLVSSRDYEKYSESLLVWEELSKFVWIFCAHR